MNIQNCFPSVTDEQPFQDHLFSATLVTCRAPSSRRPETSADVLDLFLNMLLNSLKCLSLPSIHCECLKHLSYMDCIVVDFDII